MVEGLGRTHGPPALRHSLKCQTVGKTAYVSSHVTFALIAVSIVIKLSFPFRRGLFVIVAQF